MDKFSSLTFLINALILIYVAAQLFFFLFPLNLATCNPALETEI